MRGTRRMEITRILMCGIPVPPRPSRFPSEPLRSNESVRLSAALTHRRRRGPMRAMSDIVTPPPTVAQAPPGLWGRVAAGEMSALIPLARRFWYPAYVWIRAGGYTAEDTTRLTRDFFTRMHAAGPPARDNATAARLRDYMPATLMAYITEGCPAAEGAPLIEIDTAKAESRWKAEPSKPENELFARRWSLRVLELAIGALKEEHMTPEKAPLYEAMKPFLGFNAGDSGYAGAAGALGMSASAFHMQVFEFRKRYRVLLRAQIADTVRFADDVDSELTMLLVGAG
jgi:hypothetical protein